MRNAFRLTNALRSLHKEESGQDQVEYALIASLISVSAIAATKSLATKISGEFTNVSGQLT
jgi:pilus assembly protein Flp/PilA